MEVDEDVAGLVWNRAAMEGGGPAPRSGDTSLAALLRVHGLVMNGGVFHALSCVSADELRRACLGYELFGFEGVTALFDEAAKVPSERRRLTEPEVDRRYEELSPADLIVRRFREHFEAHRELYGGVVSA